MSVDLISFVPSDNSAPRHCYSRRVEDGGKGFLQFIYLSVSPPRERGGNWKGLFELLRPFDTLKGCRCEGGLFHRRTGKYMLHGWRRGKYQKPGDLWIKDLCELSPVMEEASVARGNGWGGRDISVDEFSPRFDEELHTFVVLTDKWYSRNVTEFCELLNTLLVWNIHT